MPSTFAPYWTFAKETYETLKGGPHEPAARAYLDATARMVLIAATQRKRD